MGRRLEDAVAHGAEVESDDQFDDNEEKKYLRPRIGDIDEIVEEEKHEKGDFNQKRHENERLNIPRKNALSRIARRPLHDVGIRR